MLRILVLAACLVTTSSFWLVMSFFVQMPGISSPTAITDLSPADTEIKANLQETVGYLSSTIGPRNVKNEGSLEKTQDYITKRFEKYGYKVTRQEIPGCQQANLSVQIDGTSHKHEIVVVGAHYDSVPLCPGADDNASGIAALLELSRLLRNTKPDRTIRLIAFANEERPYFGQTGMGSYYAAQQSRKNQENIIGMLSLETLGFYSDAAGSQRYPFPFALFYPSTGNFIGFISNWNSRHFTYACISAFRKEASIGSQGCAAPEILKDIGRSDHWSYWQFHYPAIMITDTANFRYPFYHKVQDTQDKLDYTSTARVVAGLSRVLANLCGIHIEKAASL